jgi:hypothetical protein
MDAPQVEVRCPKCGVKTRHISRYRDGSTLYIHRQTKINEPFPRMRIDDACLVAKKGDETWTPK